MKTDKSTQLYDRSLKSVPAGVHSPVRAFQSVGGTPLFFESGKGSEICDVDGNKYTDFCMSWGALALGHAFPSVVEAIQEQTSKGTHFGTPTQLDVELAEIALEALSPFEKIRFVNSGTEAVMTALRLARGITKRSKVIKVNGAYHGHADSLLISAGSGLVTQGISSSDGVPLGFVAETIGVQYGSKEAIKEAFQKHKGEIAAVILEPVMANNGLFEHGKDYLDFVREVSNYDGALLIFDEVITGFRLGWGGAKSSYDIEPDIGTYGKILGGGMPIGAIAAKAEFMDHLAPNGSVYQAGTLSGNPIAMACGLATLKELRKKDFYTHIKDLGQHFDTSIANLQKEREDLPFSFSRIDSLFWFSFGSKETPKTPDEIDKNSAAAYKDVFHHLLQSGVYLAPSAYEVGFLSLAHTKVDIDKFCKAIKNL